MNYILTIVWEDGSKADYRYNSESEAYSHERDMRMVFGNQISWSGVRREIFAKF